MKGKYCIIQDDLKDCGVCSLLSIIKFYGGNISREYLREITKTDKNGVNALNLLRAAREIGFEAFGFKGNIKNIDQSKLPVIAHVILNQKFTHFVVIYEIDLVKKSILVMDPAKGYVKMSFKEFMNISSNYFLILKPKQELPKLENNNKNFLVNIKEILYKYKLVLFSVIFMSFIFTFLNILASYHFKFLYDEVNMHEIDFKVIFYILILLELFRYLIFLFRNHLINSLNFILDQELINDAYNHIIHLPYLYYKNHTNGDLLKRINDLSNLKELISNLFASIIIDLLLALIILIIMLKINFSLGLVIIITLFMYIVISIISNNIVNKIIKDNYVLASLVNNFLMESLASFETIKNLSLQNYIINAFNKKYGEYNQNSEKIVKIINLTNTFKNIVLSIGTLVVIYLGIISIKNMTINITFLITFISLSNYLIQPVKNILDLQLLFLESKESIRRIKEIYAIPIEVTTLNKKKSFPKLSGRIEIDNLSYSYNGIDKIINHFSMEIKEGSRVLIYGKSGCGKSTLMHLLIKYINSNYEGNITIGGFDMKDLDLYTLRQNICYVSQNEYLYTDTIYENITLGRKIKYEQFLQIAKGVFLNEIIKNSNLGYDFFIESNGENISGGERKRIIIARSLLTKANIYIYDETFSGIDIEKEREILKYIFQLYKDKTFIIISHRMSNIDLFDNKIAFEGGCCESK